MSLKRFRIAFSFAGEKRDFVAQTAAILATYFGKEAILYDKFHEAEFAVYDLGIRLPKLYGEQSELIVPVLCPNYDGKRWTGWEWVHIYGLLTKVEGNRVMPSRFEYANADGLSPTAGFIELDNKSPEEFVRLILERLALNEGKERTFYVSSVTNTVSPSIMSIPHNLPSLQPFFGREDELHKIADALDPESRTWGALIEGPGGMGKTSLAVRAAYDVSSKAFDKIVFVSLKTRELDDDGIRDLSGFLISGLSELLNELARELGNPEISKSPEEHRPQLLLERLRGTRTLLLLDNLESLLKTERDTIFTFVKKLPQGCKAILTSRGRIGSGAEELILGKLSETAALSTIEKLAENNPALAKTSREERLALYRETGGKPLLLRWTAGQIGRGSCTTLADAIDYLRSCPEDNDPLEFIFGDLVEGFTEVEACTLCGLTYFNLPAKVEHLIGLTDQMPQTIDRALRSLVNRSLVLPNDEQTTFILVPLVADFLRKKRPEIVATTGNLLAEKAYKIIIENGYENHSEFHILEEAWPIISAVLPRFISGPSKQLQIVCGALFHPFTFSGRYDESIALNGDAEKKAVLADDFLSAGWRAHHACWMYSLRRQPEKVAECANRAQEYWQKANLDLEGRARMIRLIGDSHEEMNDHSAAISAYNEALQLLRPLNQECSELAICLNALAGAQRSSGDTKAAEGNFREALRICRLINEEQGIVSCMGNLAILAIDGRDWLTAESISREGLELAEKLGRQDLLANNYYRLALSLQKQNKKKAALPFIERAIKIYEPLRSPFLEAAIEIRKKCTHRTRKSGQ